MGLGCRAALLGLFCSRFGLGRAVAKPLLGVSLKTLTAAGAAGTGAASGGKGAAVRGTAAAMAAASRQRQRRRVVAAAKSQKVGQARSEAIPPIKVEGVSAEGGGSRRTGGNPQPLSI